MKNTLEEINIRLGYTECKSDTEDRIMQILIRSTKRKTLKKMRTV